MLSPAFVIFSCFKDNSYAPNFLNLFKHPIRSLPEGRDMVSEKNKGGLGHWNVNYVYWYPKFKINTLSHS